MVFHVHFKTKTVAAHLESSTGQKNIEPKRGMYAPLPCLGPPAPSLQRKISAPFACLHPWNR